MASRSRDKEKKTVTKTVSTTQRSFVFGSSTPRDLSHMNKIPLKQRSYDVREKHRSAGPPLREYMEKARCISRNGSADGRNWAFGSSTPRDFSHLTRVDPKFRRYDAVLPREKGSNPLIGTTVKRSITAPPINRSSHTEQVHKPSVTTRIKKEDDTSSEPDFVQDRAEFIDELKRGIKERNEKEKARQADYAKNQMDQTEAPHNNDKRLSLGESTEDSVTFSQATDLADVISFNERVPHDVHEEEEATAQRQSVQGLQDQITVSELNETLEDMNLSKRRTTPPLIQDILRKVEDVANNVTETSQSVAETVQESVEAAASELGELKATAQKGLDQVIRVGTEMMDDISEQLDEDTGETNQP